MYYICTVNSFGISVFYSFSHNSFCRYAKILAVLLLLGMLGGNALAQNAATDYSYYIPQVHGVIRTRLEVDTENAQYRFQVRNARINFYGHIAPPVDYYINTDFCDRGKVKILDAWLRLQIVKGLRFQAGQFRMPFGFDTHRAPNNYFFANRSFIGKQICNFRAVGAKVAFDIPHLPLLIEAGAFNPATISDHDVWSKKVTYSAKATFSPGMWRFTAGSMSVICDDIRANLFDAAAGLSVGRWTAEAEYIYKHFTAGSPKSVHGYNAFADYRMPVSAGIFNALSFQARFDGMTAHAEDPACNRITVGSTISYIRTKAVGLHMRANFEKYIYRRNAVHSNPDRLTVEIVATF